MIFAAEAVVRCLSKESHDRVSQSVTLHRCTTSMLKLDMHLKGFIPTS